MGCWQQPVGTSLDVKTRRGFKPPDLLVVEVLFRAAVVRRVLRVRSQALLIPQRLLPVQLPIRKEITHN